MSIKIPLDSFHSNITFQNESNWFFLYPYVYVSVKKDMAIAFNTLTGKLLEFPGGSPIYKIIKRLHNDSNLYVIKIKSSQIDRQTEAFINQIRNLFFGDIIDVSLSTRKPIQFKPILNLQTTLEGITIGNDKPKSLIQDDLPDYLSIMNLYINNDCKQSCTFCQGAYKQFLCCHKRKGRKTQLTQSDIIDLMNQVNNSSLHKLNIQGGNIFLHPTLEELVRYLNSIPILKEYHFHYLNIQNRTDFFKLMEGSGNQITVTIHLPINTDELAAKVKIMAQYKLKNKLGFQFAVQQEEDIKLAETMIAEFKLEKYQLTPFFNGENLDFFQDYVFLDRESILEGKPQMNDILEHTVLNRSDFKKLTVLSDKSVYANLNHPKAGKLGKDHIMKIIYNELHKGKSWTKVRKHANPCKCCAYNALCPPICNYEYAIGRYDLCNIKSQTAG
jgi:pseudo-rSAM protein